MNFIAGNWVEGSGESFHSLSPATQRIIWTGRASHPNDVDSAVQAAHSASSDWARLSITQRSKYLLAFRAQLEQHQVELTRAITEEGGKPLWDAATEVSAMISKIHSSLSALSSRRVDNSIPIAGGNGRTRYKPHGVTAVYGPFNFPGHIANGQIIPALAAGNTIVLKPSELTPRVAELTIKLWEKAEIPPGVINLVQGGRECGESLAKHPEVNAVLFTGSLRTGIALRQALVPFPEKLLALELGGNNPLIVHRVREILPAIYWTVQSAYLSSGQRCTCARRLICTEGNDELITLLIKAVNNIEVGAPDGSPQPFMGPLIHTQAADRVLEEQERMMNHGAIPLVQSERLSLGPAYLSPGLIDVTNCSVREDKELFGPILQLIRVPNLKSAIEEANRTQYGLACAVFTQNREDYELVFDQVKSGLINWNKPTTGASGELPFGGVGRSGNHRAAGSFTVDYCNIPVASLESNHMGIPANLPPGFSMP
ncbi:succinylglutamate-semialdehyde dehydrogenase [Planctomicrobium sp. SH668]|uniref:succinylglutamate-semialdehyde dehydrogenase n=1 Tax=Planctomicrobium sp. SH668 TaxID=3448126 RepID=UPI003F5C993C